MYTLLNFIRTVISGNNKLPFRHCKGICNKLQQNLISKNSTDSGNHSSFQQILEELDLISHQSYQYTGAILISNICCRAGTNIKLGAYKLYQLVDDSNLFTTSRWFPQGSSLDQNPRQFAIIAIHLEFFQNLFVSKDFQIQ